MNIDEATSARIAALSAGDFEPLVGTTLEVGFPSGPVTVVVANVHRGGAGPKRQAFSVTFEGDAATSSHPQGTYLVHAAALGDPLPLFLVPRRPERGRAQWEATFG